MKKPYLSIIIPAYNEETNIRLGALEKVARYLLKQEFSWEVLIVNDGSSDNSKQLITEFSKENPGFQLINNVHQGKAATVISGIRHASGEIILFSDLDQATPIKELEDVLPWFKENYDVVIGSRSSQREGAPMLRRLMAVGFMMIRGFVLGLRGITDTQCGFKAFRSSAANAIIDKLKLYHTGHEIQGSMVTAGFDIELLFVARRLGYKIREVPVEWHYVETRRVNPIKDSIHGLIDIFKIRMNAFQGKYS